MKFALHIPLKPFKLAWFQLRALNYKLNLKNYAIKLYLRTVLIKS